jgi:serine protease Do
MATQPTAPRRSGGTAYPSVVWLVLLFVAAGALLGGLVLPRYVNVPSNPPQSSTSGPHAVPPANGGTAPAPPGGPTPNAVFPAPPRTSGLTAEESVVINVVKSVRPSVVNINTESQVQTMFGASPEQGAGSGVIVRTDGYVLTNNHVVEGATTIKVTLAGGKTLTGRVVGTDPFADLAVVKVDSPDPLPAAALGSSSSLQVGQLAIAIGNPFGLGSTVTTGVVSALNRNIQLPNLIVENLIQTSAQINPGNSGGALVDSSGRVIGINTAILPNAQGIGFAIPSDIARAEMEQLITKGQVVRPWVGVDYGGEIDPQVARAYNLNTDHGMLVRGVEPGSPAAKAGLQPNDIITEVSGQPVTSWNDFVQTIIGKKIGDSVTLTFIRDGATHKVAVTLTERPAETH